MRSSTVVCSIATVVCAVVVGLGITPAAADPSTLADIEKAVNVDAIPADYVILADTSASMKNKYAGLKSGLRAFFAALAPTDKVTLVTFDRKARIAYQGDVGKSPDALVSKLPREADGTATDIGAALEEAVNTLARKDAPAIASVVLVTDGRHEPPPDSAYVFTQGYAWSALRKKVQELHKVSLNAYSIPIAGAPGGAQLGAVFPHPVALAVNSIDELTQRMEQPKAAAGREKIRQALAGDMSKGITVTWPDVTLGPGSTHMTLKLHSESSKIPLTFSDVKITGRDGFTAVPDRQNMVLQPGSTVDLPVTVQWAAPGHGWAYHKSFVATAQLELTGTVDSPWTQTLAGDLGLGNNFRPLLGGATGAVHGEAELGRPWRYNGLVLLVVIVIALLVRLRFVRPMLFDVLYVSGPGATTARKIPLQGRGSSVVLTPQDTGEPDPIRLRVVRSGGQKQLRVTAGSDKGRTLRPGGDVTIRSVLYQWRPEGVPVDAPRGTDFGVPEFAHTPAPAAPSVVPIARPPRTSSIISEQASPATAPRWGAPNTSPSSAAAVRDPDSGHLPSESRPRLAPPLPPRDIDLPLDDE